MRSSAKTDEHVSEGNDDGTKEIDISAVASTYGYLVRRAHERNYRAFNARFADMRINTIAYALLAIVERNPGVRQGRVAEKLGFQESNMATLVGDLTQRKLIYRVRSKSDRRAYGLALTSQGQAVVDDLKIRASEIDVANTQALTARERKMLIRLLSKLDSACEAP